MDLSDDTQANEYASLFLDDLYDAASEIVEDLFAKTEIRKETMSLEEVAKLDEIIQFGTLQHCEYLLSMIRDRREQEVVDCFAAHYLFEERQSEELTRSIDESLKDENIRALMNQELAKKGLRLATPEEKQRRVQIQLTADHIIGNPVLDPIDRDLKEVVEEYRARIGKGHEEPNK